MDENQNQRPQGMETRTRVIIIALVVLILVGVGVGYLVYKRVAQPIPTGAELQSPPGIVSIPTVGAPPTREYVKDVQQSNIEQARKALREGTAAVPTLTRATYVGGEAFTDVPLAGRPKVDCSVDALKRARASGVTAFELRCAGCSAAALRAAGYTAGELRDAGFTAAQLRAAGFSAQDLKDAGFSAADLKAAGFSAQDLKDAGFSAAQLKDAGFSAAQLRAAGFSAQDLKDAGFSAADLKAAGFSAQDLKDAGFTAAQLKGAGFSASDLKAAGFTAGELKNAGFTPGELAKAGFTQSEIAAPAAAASICGDVSALKVERDKGVTAAELRQKYGCDAKQLAAAGYSAAELKDAGFTAQQLKDAGFNAAQLKAAGFSAKDLKDAGFSAADLRNAGFSAKDLKDAGFSAAQLKDAGFSAADLKAAGFSAKDLKDAGFSAKQLKDAGFSAADLKAAGFSPGELKDAGFSAADLKAAGFSAKDLRDAGFSAADLKAAGFSTDDLKQAGFTHGDLLRAGVAPELAAPSPVAAACDVNSLRQAKAQGVSAAVLKARGCSVAALKAAGFTASELAAAGFTPSELAAGGFTPQELAAAGIAAVPGLSAVCDVASLRQAKEQGVSAAVLKARGCSVAALKAAGFTASELAAAGFTPEPGIPTTVSLPPISPEAQRLRQLQARQAAMLSQQQRQDLTQQMVSAMQNQANQLFNDWNQPSPQVMIAAEAQMPATGAGGSAPGGTLGAVQTEEPTIKAGTVMYAVLDTGINSDQVSPIMATLVTGPYRGGKLLGQFTRVDDKVVLNFTTLNLPQYPKSISINADAIDSRTARTAMASDANHHYLLRYGTLFASSFVSGLSQAIQQSGSQTSAGLGGIIVTHDKLSSGEQISVALGNVGNAYAQAMGQNFTTPPTVYVYAGTGIGILFMSDVTLPAQ